MNTDPNEFFVLKMLIPKRFCFQEQHLVPGLEIILNLLDTQVFNPKPTDFRDKVKEFKKPQNLHFKYKSRKIMQQNVFYVMILYYCEIDYKKTTIKILSFFRNLFVHFAIQLK